MTKTSILVTGGCGYLGSHMLRSLKEHHAGPVRVLDNLSRGTPAALMDHGQNGVWEFIEGDILDPSTLREAMEGVDTVVHLAAVAHPPFSFAHGTSTTQVNQWGTAQVVEQAVAAGVQRFVYASSASVYGPGDDFAEDAPTRPVGLYAHSKQEAERSVAASELDSVILRMGMLYGGEPPVLRFDAVPNRFAYLAATGRSITVHGDGKQRRPVLHVDDACAALTHGLGVSSGTYNVAEANPEIRELAQAAAGARDAHVRFTDQDYRQHFSLGVDSTAFGNTGWRAERDYATGLPELMGRFGPWRSRNAALELMEEA